MKTQRHIRWTGAMAALALGISVGSGAAFAAQGTPSQESVKITGEVVDLWCYLDHHGHGLKHRKCAITCAEAGNPIGIVDDKGHVYVAMGGEKHQPGRDVLIQRMAETVTVEGRLVREGGVDAVYVDDVVELQGYCPVAYHKMGKAVMGNPEFRAEYNGKTFFFVKAKARDVFLKHPQKFLPALDGKCIVCKVKMHKDVPGNPTIFSVYKGKVYLFASEEQKRAFDENPERFVQAVNR